MATFKAKIKRVLEPAAFQSPPNNPVFRTDTFFDFTEKLNNWTIRNATMIIDYTVLIFIEGNISTTGAIRCTNVLSYEDRGSTSHGIVRIQNYIGGVGQLGGSLSSNCQMWPCCAVGMMSFPLIKAGASDTGTIFDLPSGVDVGFPYQGFTTNGVQYLMMNYGPGLQGGGNNLLTHFYITIDMMIYDNSVP